ncbi:gamma-glutamyl-gamma-aminobutyrate hydrolase family protein [Pseudoroseomonas cervicalis]|uniref:gamma-glutamyl-gamma-aminobutyrate hydrolase family protein n=1 Tax=Teichococcus cervicalis TaxID=204525 RepID=UPI0022F15E43|nr:gamma-glutamyl-gamma-aminobutyrate hydrolase family protein [Pseudoroseomonas cervicalis]WBV42219.1 gamma-glutamyl-gamma-aminobutyrate hydrolase family protein [Pseudoroseomonas cervicalis]
MTALQTSRRPWVGVPACHRELGGHWQHATPSRYMTALAEGAGVRPVLIPPLADALDAEGFLERLDGLLVPGSPSNVQPALYGGGAAPEGELEDPDRDATTLPLIRAALARGLPVLAICRGLQEMNVAFGGTLHGRLHLLEGRDDHRGQGSTSAERYRMRHEVTAEGLLRQVTGQARFLVNSVHMQGVDRVAPGLAVEALAPDGTVEALRPEAATGFQLAVQWHPEWRFHEDAPSTALFRAFGAACQGVAP